MLNSFKFNYIVYIIYSLLEHLILVLVFISIFLFSGLQSKLRVLNQIENYVHRKFMGKNNQFWLHININSKNIKTNFIKYVSKFEYATNCYCTEPIENAIIELSLHNG